MKFADRLKIFAVGFTVGMVLLFFILSKRQGDRNELTAPRTAEEVQLEAVPGILHAYRDRRVAMDSKFITEQHREPLPDNRWKRTLILRGMDPEQVVRVVEFTHEEAGYDLVDRVVVMAPDRLTVTLPAGVSPPQLAEAVHPWGYRLTEKTADGTGVLVAIGGNSLADYRQAVERLQSLSDLTTDVQPVIYGEAEPFAGESL
ncbi:hypothetical protein H5P28_17405 [Ruficoccus amylovorans]|uniref:Uncharacterized protein n=1 Tax=Ruficoccus amylovorans TaxID=1804625 RepID=A0A842HKP5_9BACT|nr:hypothetical protein [Ruficoccus amylovorans]MBC2596047.1 hypothetical protein [Ruficoccus amylovorans]